MVGRGSEGLAPSTVDSIVCKSARAVAASDRVGPGPSRDRPRPVGGLCPPGPAHLNNVPTADCSVRATVGRRALATSFDPERRA